MPFVESGHWPKTAFEKQHLESDLKKNNWRVFRQTPSDVTRAIKKVKFYHRGGPLLWHRHAPQCNHTLTTRTPNVTMALARMQLKRSDVVYYTLALNIIIK